jgi:pyrimidine operon attenuation protein/uracil phosphoribosyltransferase
MAIFVQTKKSMQRILDHQAFQQKLTRIAHQIIENVFDEKKIYFGGIAGNGYEMAKALQEKMKQYADQEVELFEIKVNKEEPWSEEIQLSLPIKELKNAYIIIVDDVLNSGKTMQYTLVTFLQQATKAIKTVAMVDRKHRRYPIKADFVGLSLSTTMQDRVEVFIKNNKFEAFLV